jgi:hypothetical protein
LAGDFYPFDVHSEAQDETSCCETFLGGVAGGLFGDAPGTFVEKGLSGINHKLAEHSRKMILPYRKK